MEASTCSVLVGGQRDAAPEHGAGAARVTQGQRFGHVHDGGLGEPLVVHGEPGVRARAASCTAGVSRR